MPVETTQRPGAREVAAIVRSLTKENRAESPIVQLLGRQVANSFVLYVNFKRYHWQTYGPHFRDLHKLFDKFAGQVLGGIDAIAERVRMIGQNPPASWPEIAALASVNASTADSMSEMIQEARRNAVIMIDEFRQGARIAQEHDDPGTVDLCSKLVQVHEMQEWWLRDLLRDGDGLS